MNEPNRTGRKRKAALAECPGLGLQLSAKKELQLQGKWVFPSAEQWEEFLRKGPFPRAYPF